MSRTESEAVIKPAWHAPSMVGAAMSTRVGGFSRGPFESLNLRPPGLLAPAESVHDDPQAQAANIDLWARTLGVQPFFLRQVHGAQVALLDGLGAPPQPCADWTAWPTADAAVTTRTDVACTVLVADCLPVLLTDRRGRAVAAAHAGWRGLSGGVLEATARALCEAARCPPTELLAWLGPCIGPSAFEVGADVLQAFGASPDSLGRRFVDAPRPDGSPRWRADLAGLAHDRLVHLGVGAISGSDLCTVSEPSRFFSFRRDGLTGRLAASIWRRG